MKNREEIENLSFEALERIASDESVLVPEGLERKIEDGITAAGLIEPRKGRVPLRKVLFGSFATLAAAAAAVSVVYYADRGSQPADTFSDPHQAYEEIQKTFDYISSEMNRGTSVLKQIK